MTPAALVELLREFSRERLELLRRHEAAARAATDYDQNNACQYVIAREDVHLSWLRDALQRLSGAEVDEPAPSAEPRGRPEEILREESGRLRAFDEAWKGRVDAITNARHRQMLRVILGESIEHARLLDQAAAGRTDLLGRRPAGMGTGGGVLPTRWLE